jgi:cell division protein FtsN
VTRVARKSGARSRASARSRSGWGGTLLGVLIGLVLGALVALAVAWYFTRTPLPFQRPTAPAAEALRPPEAAAAKAPAPGQVATPAPLPGKPGDKPLERPRYDFYKILPEGEQRADAPAAPPPEPAAGAEEAPEAVFLQAGSFMKEEQADNLKAKLALIGVEAGVYPATIPDKGILHRVRIGPFSKPEEMSRVRALLAENGVQAKVVKAKEGAGN